MSIFDQPLANFRYVLTEHGDTMPEIAYRETGDAEQWPQLVWMNGLSYPYITDDPASAGNGVILSGQQIMVPGALQSVAAGTKSNEVYGRDVLLDDGVMLDNGEGDFEVASGLTNLNQQLKHRIDTPRGELIYHPEYGCSIHEIKGETENPARLRLSAEYVRTSLLEDYRVIDVNNASATANGDADEVVASVTPIVGGAVDVVTRA